MSGLAVVSLETSRTNNRFAAALLLVENRNMAFFQSLPSCSTGNNGLTPKRNEGSAMPTVLKMNSAADENDSAFASGGRFDLRCLGGQSKRLLKLDSGTARF